jgi:hypothetical protein
MMRALDFGRRCRRLGVGNNTNTWASEYHAIQYWNQAKDLVRTRRLVYAERTTWASRVLTYTVVDILRSFTPCERNYKPSHCAFR